LLIYLKNLINFFSYTETGPIVPTACCKAFSSLAATSTNPLSVAPTLAALNAHFPSLAVYFNLKFI